MSNSRFRRWIIDMTKGPVEFETEWYGVTEDQSWVRLIGTEHKTRLYSSYAQAAHDYYVFRLQIYRDGFLGLKQWIDKLEGCGDNVSSEFIKMLDTFTLEEIDTITGDFWMMAISISKNLRRLRDAKADLENEKSNADAGEAENE